MVDAVGSSLSIQSIASTHTILQPTSIPTKPSTRTVIRKSKSDLVLSDLWLLTAQQFMKLGKLSEARKAIEEAENVNWTSNPRVWCVYGQLLVKENKLQQAQDAFQKALVIDPNDIGAQLGLAKVYIQQDHLELAEGILENITGSNGWDSAEAW